MGNEHQEANNLESIQLLLEESNKLEEVASKIQQGQQIGISTGAIDAFIEIYHKWYAECLSLLPEDLKGKFRLAYEGSFWNAKIKKFLEAFAERSLLFASSDEKGKEIFSYWAYPYKQNFYPHFLTQRQLLIEAIQLLSTTHAPTTANITKLLEESNEIEKVASQIQQGEQTGLSLEAIQALVEKYLVWYGYCLSLLPDDLKDRFRSEYEGTWYALKIKKFLEAPTTPNVLYTMSSEKNELKLLSHWLYPYISTFHNPLLAQRQILIEASKQKMNIQDKKDKDIPRDNIQSAKTTAFLFEQLVPELLQTLGFTGIEPLREDYGFDLQAIYASKSLTGAVIPQQWLISIKYRGRSEPTETTSLTRYITSLLSSPQVNHVAKVLFIDYSNLTSFGREYTVALIKEFGGRVEVWDREELDKLLLQFPLIRKKYESIISQIPHSLSLPLQTEQAKIVESLSKCKPGREHWHDFEDICIDVLTKAFVPPLKRVEPQAKTISGLERRDALLPLLGVKDGWEQISQKYDAHFLLCEFKNYVEPIGKEEVNTTVNYLKKHIGRLGIIFSRLPPSPSALNMRRSVYADTHKLILFLEDKHLIEILKLKEANQNPLDLIYDAIHDFLLKYE